MPTDHRAVLANIKTFPQLIAYLRDEMGWPIVRDSFVDVDDLFYDFTADELGIDPKTAAKIQEIKRLRPLSPKQPWGIFFVKFEPKRLPVVALRRLLSQVAVKKRPSANSAERAAWSADDLLFVSNYGEGDERQISFAHFSRAQDGHDLPTLKVLGWDNRDTALRLDAVAKELTQHLAWPDDDTDAEVWRIRWRAAFTLRHHEVVTTSKELSIRLARLAGDIRDRIKSALAIETDRGPLTRLLKAFQTSLVHDLDADGFADMYAQTIAYGLLSARITDPHKKTVDDFAGHMRTNPFLRELMETFLKVGGRRGKAGGQGENKGIDFDELGVSEVVQLLDDANMEAVVLDFGDRNRQEDPVIHFYELFLSAYNKQLKIQRGVFYTPQPVVSYIVRSVHELLQTEFGLADGLADTTTWGAMLKKYPGLKLPPLTDEPGEKRTISPDEPFVQVLDPATGTATFLVEVIEVIHSTLAAKWKQQRLTDAQQRAAWNDYVPQHLLPRLYAFELMMAPYAIAHMKIGLKLAETGYRFGTEERARIYLTNALEPWVKQLPLIGFDALAHETAAVNEIKRHKRFTVVIGNPPYSNFGQLNKIPFILGLLDDYKRGLDEKKINLDDDFIKFVRLSQHLLDATGAGVFGMITNNSFVDGITHRQMRHTLLACFNRLHILNLHGSSKKKEKAPDGSVDENVFDIQQGVSISIFSKSDGVKREVTYSDLWGGRPNKYQTLDEATIVGDGFVSLNPIAHHYFFVPKNFSDNSEYQQWLSLEDIFPLWQNGIKTDRDELFWDFDKEALAQRIKVFFSCNYSNEFREQYRIYPSSSYDIEERRKVTRFSERSIQPCLKLPFDVRWLYYDPRLTSRPGQKVMEHMQAGPNLGLLVSRQAARGFRHVLVSNTLVNVNSLDTAGLFGGGPFFPLYLYEDAMSLGFGGAQTLSKRPNYSNTFLKAFASTLTLSQSGIHGIPDGIAPEDIFHYAYAVFHSPGYRSRYAEFLKIDFPRLPLTGNLELFRALARLGGELTALQLLESPKLDRFITTYTGPKHPEIGRVGWSDETVWLDAAATKKGQPATPGTIGFRGVPEAVWNFHIGGYQVCEKWLKDRKGRTLSKDDIAHYQKIVVALNETIRLMQEIDAVIEQHGGWPGAFQTGEAQAAASKVIPFQPRIVQPNPKELYVTCVPLVPLKVAAGAFSDPQHIDDDGFEWTAVETKRRLRPGMFVAQVVGKSMEPFIPDGAYCLFVAPVEGTRQGKTVLVQLRNATDPESGERYTVKRYESEKLQEGGSWRHEKITLKPINPDFKPIVLTGADECQLRVIAEFVEVLTTGLV